MNIFSKESVPDSFFEMSQEILQSDAVKQDSVRGPPAEAMFSRAQRGRSIELETMENNRFQRLRRFGSNIPAEWYAYTENYFYIYSNQSFMDYTILAKVSITSKNRDAIDDFMEALENGTYKHTKTFDHWTSDFRRGKGRYHWDSIRDGNRGTAMPSDGVDGRKRRSQNTRDSKEGGRIGTAEVTDPKEKFSREATDKSYLAAVESGDMDTAQRMVDEATKTAGYNRRMFHETDANNIHLSQRFDETQNDIRYSREYKQEVIPYGQEGTAEDHVSFVRRMHESSRRVKQVGEITYGFSQLRILDASGTATGARRELQKLGIRCFLHDGLEFNYRGHTYRDKGFGGSLPDGSVAIYGRAYGNGIEIAGHEAFHVWSKTDSGNAYIEIVRKNIDFSASSYGIQQANHVLKAYFGNNVDAIIGDSPDKIRNKAQFMEELYALVSGKIHSGADEANLKTMFQNYDAVKTAWKELVQNQSGIKLSREFVQGQMDQQQKQLEQVNAALEKENGKLREDNRYLQELVKLQKTVTNGTKFTKTSVIAAARMLKKKANVKHNANPAELVRLLEDFYGYIAKGDEITWESVMEAAQPAVGV